MLRKLAVAECWRWVDTIQVQLDTLEAVGLRQVERALLAIEGVSSLVVGSQTKERAKVSQIRLASPNMLKGSTLTPGPI